MFRAVLPPLNSNQTVLDVGSRLGAVLYGAYLFSGAGKIQGIEINKDLCELQNRVIKAFNFGGRASVIHANMITRPDLFALADVVVLNNVFEWFAESSEQVAMWRFLCSNIKAGALIVTMPSIEKAVEGLRLDMSIEMWIRPLNHTAPDIVSSMGEIDFTQDVHLYQVINRPPIHDNPHNDQLSSSSSTYDMQ